MSTSFNPFQPPETRDQPQQVGARFAQASFFEFMIRGLLCAGLLVLMTGIEQFLPVVPLKDAATFTGGIRTVLCTGFLMLFCGWVVQSELPGTWFFALGTGLELVAVIGGYCLVVFVVSSFPVSSFGPLLFVMNLVLNVVETIGLAVAFGSLTKRQLRIRVFVVTFLLCILYTVLSYVVIAIPRLFVGTISANILLSMTISISGSFGLLSTATALWYVNLQPAKVK